MLEKHWRRSSNHLFHITDEDASFQKRLLLLCSTRRQRKDRSHKYKQGKRSELVLRWSHQRAFIRGGVAGFSHAIDAILMILYIQLNQVKKTQREKKMLSLLSINRDLCYRSTGCNSNCSRIPCVLYGWTPLIYLRCTSNKYGCHKHGNGSCWEKKQNYIHLIQLDCTMTNIFLANSILSICIIKIAK